MNDFTKEDLKILLYGLYGGIYDDFPVPEENVVLQSKIQSMIENYCDHVVLKAGVICLQCMGCNKCWSEV